MVDFVNIKPTFYEAFFCETTRNSPRPITLPATLLRRSQQLLSFLYFFLSMGKSRYRPNISTQKVQILRKNWHFHTYNKGQTVALFNNQVCLKSLAVHDLSPTIQLLEGKTSCPLTGQQHLEDVVREVRLVIVVRGVQVVLVVQIDQHLEDIVQGSEFPNGSQQPFNFSCKFLYFDQIFNLVVLF